MHIFNRVKFNTPESVELEFTLAGIGNRAWALIIDYLVLSTILLAFFIIWTIGSVALGDFLGDIFGSGLGLWLVAIAILISATIYAGYFIFLETFWQGQTPGKRVAKIRVVREDGRLVGLPQASLRTLLRPLDEFLFIGAFLIMFNRREKRLGDLAAGTIVIQAETTSKSAKFTISDPAKLLYPNLLEIADLSRLLPDDFAIIREYLQRRDTITSRAKATLSIKLAQQVQAIINLETLPASIESDVFLEAVYLAYQQPQL